MKTFEFPSGRMPAIGLGTWKMDDGSATAAVKQALEAGYRHIDCAPIYLNEPDVGKAFESFFAGGDVSREELWVTSKLWNNRHRPDLVQEALKSTLFDLRLEYLDLYMIHWPIVFKDHVHRPESGADYLSLQQMPLIDTWQAMEDCVDAGLCRNLGVCNFKIDYLKDILNGCRIRPSANQVECQPYLNQRELLDFCQGEKIQLVAYSPLGSGDRPDRMKSESDPNLFDDPELQRLAEDCGITAGQLMLAWAVNRGTVAIPKSSNAQRQRENLAAGEVELSSEVMEAIETLGTKHRYVHGKFWEVPGGPYTAAELWGEEG